MNADIHYDILISKSNSDFEKYYDLPIAVYVSAVDGSVIKHNRYFNEVFHISLEVKNTQNIIKFYKKEYHRKAILKKLAALKENEWLKDEILEFCIDNNFKSFRFWSKPYFDDDNNHIGHVCLLIPMSEFEQFKDLEEIIPVGFFEVDENGKLLLESNRCKEILKINTDRDSFLNVKDFFTDEEAFKKIFRQVLQNKKDNGKTSKERVTLKKMDNTFFIANLYMKAEYDEQNKIEKIKGVLEDVTFDSIRRDAPIGVYLTMKNGNDNVIVNANKQFSDLLGYESLEILEKEYGKLRESEFFADYSSFNKSMDKSKKGVLSNHKLELINNSGNVKEVLITAKNIRQSEGFSLGRVSLIYDITDNVNHKLEEWSSDFASLLHSHASILNSIQDTIFSIIEGHKSELVKEDKVDLQRTFLKISENINLLTSNISKFFTYCKTNKNFNNETALEINEKLSFITIKDIKNYKERASWIRLIAIEIRNEYQLVSTLKGSIKEQYVENIENNINEILRYAKLISLFLTNEEITEAFESIQIFKKSLTAGTLIELEKDEIDIISILNKITTSLSNSAAAKNLSIIKEYEGEEKGIRLIGAKKELHDAIYNVIHNAIKYSWLKKGNKPGRIKINVTNDFTSIKIKIENFGVPIKKFEIDQDLIFKFNYRGANSDDRHRYGWGIGLWQTKKLINAHKGSIKAISVPADGVSSDYPNNPYLTTFTIVLPKKQ